MAQVGAYEAKTRLSELLERVSRGERIVITRHGVPVAVLQPVESERTEELPKVVEKLRQYRKGQRLGDDSLRSLLEEGRR